MIGLAIPSTGIGADDLFSGACLVAEDPVTSGGVSGGDGSSSGIFISPVHATNV